MRGRCVHASRGVLLLSLCTALVLGCAPPDDQRTGEVTRERVEGVRAELPAELRTLLDSGNAAVRRGDHERALTWYRSATEGHPDVAAAWFGVFMSAQALGRAEEAASALERARMLEPGASLLRDDSVANEEPRR